jgi:hypothetical protein
MLIASADSAACLDAATQILHWQHKDTAAEGPPSKRRRTRSSAASNHTTSSTADSSSRPQLVLELQDQSEEAAALTVLQSMYAVEPLGQLLAKLRQEQLLQAAMLADKWQVPDVSAAAVQALPRDDFSRELLQQFVQCPLCQPSCCHCLVPWRRPSSAMMPQAQA